MTEEEAAPAAEEEGGMTSAVDVLDDSVGRAEDEMMGTEAVEEETAVGRG